MRNVSWLILSFVVLGGLASCTRQPGPQSIEAYNCGIDKQANAFITLNR